MLFKNSSETGLSSAPIVTLLGTGTYHEEDNGSCQDRLSAVFHKKSRRTVLVVSDGCSSSAYAEEAAQWNVAIIQKLFSKFSVSQVVCAPRETLTKCFQLDTSELPKDATLGDCLTEVFRQEFLREKKRMENRLHHPIEDNDLLATIVFAVWENERLLIGHVGDGNAVCLDKKGRIVYRSEQENGGESNRTYFTNRRDVRDHIHCMLVNPAKVERVVLFTDGLQSLFKGETGTIEDGVRKLIGNKPIASDAKLLEIFRGPLTEAKYYGFDDWSLVVANKDALRKQKDGIHICPQAKDALSLLKIFKAGKK